jgi:hypothetical protein
MEIEKKMNRAERQITQDIRCSSEVEGGSKRTSESKFTKKTKNTHELASTSAPISETDPELESALHTASALAKEVQILIIEERCLSSRIKRSNHRTATGADGSSAFVCS